MAFSARMILILTLMLPLARAIAAQETTQKTTATAGTAETSTATATAVVEQSTAAVPEVALTSSEIRSQFGNLLREHPYELAMLLKLDPSLMSNETFLGGYPELARFIEKHPEVRRNARFYLADFPVPGRSNSVLDDIADKLAAMGAFILAVFAFIWLVRAMIEQRRWNRLSRTQSEVHNKILDRFGTSSELLEYIKTPAGTKFLESAPIPLHTDQQPARNAPLTRIMWSIQLGVVIAAGGLGMLLVSFRFDGETAQGLFAMGAIAFCVGAGFIASAVVSLLLSRRLGLWTGPGAAPFEALDDAGRMR